MPINSFPPVILMYSLYHFSPQGGYHLVTLKLRRLALRRTGVTVLLHSSYVATAHPCEGRNCICHTSPRNLREDA